MPRRDLKIRDHTIAQAPNPPLIVAALALLVAALADADTTLDDAARALFYVAITVWAWEEAAHGVNRFRRALGAVALALVVVSVARVLG